MPKGFIGLSYGIFGIGYQFSLYNDLSSNKSPIAHSHSLALGIAMENTDLICQFRFLLPIKIITAEDYQ